MRNGSRYSLSSASWWVRLWVRNGICLICLVSVLSIPVWSEISNNSEPDWPELTSSLNEIDSGLQMIGTASDEIETSQQQREKLLREKEKYLDERDNSLNKREQLLGEREQGLNAREQGLDERASLYSGMQVDLEKAHTDLKKAKRWGIFYVVLAALGGYLVAKL